MTVSFETVLGERVAEMVDACTRCGKCVEACPITGPAEVAAEPRAVIEGVFDILRLGIGPELSRRWAQSCVLSGECIKACDEGVNPRFLLIMARAALARADNEPAEMRKRGLDNFRTVSRDVSHLSKMQLSDELLERLGQRGTRSAQETTLNDEPPDFIFYTGCNVLKTPHIALLALDIMDTLAVTYRVLGGPTHCCGVVQLRAGDLQTSGRVAKAAIDKLTGSKSGQVLAWCSSCYQQYSETSLPTIERMRGSRPFEMVPFMRFLHQHLDRLRPHLREPVPMRIALHRHPGVPGVVEAAEDILTAIPGIVLVDLHQPAIGLMSNNLATLPTYKRELYLAELKAAAEARVDALVAVYHPDHRELCAHEAEWPFQILNVLELVARSMGLHRDDDYKRLKLMQDVDAILDDCDDMLVRHGLDRETSRKAVEGMLKDQPVPLTGGQHVNG